MKRLLIIILIIFTAFFLLPAMIVMIFSGAGHHTQGLTLTDTSTAKAAKESNSHRSLCTGAGVTRRRVCRWNRTLLVLLLQKCRLILILMP